MTLDPRHIPTTKAASELSEAVAKIAERHNLTSFEILSLLNQQVQSELNMCLKYERRKGRKR